MKLIKSRAIYPTGREVLYYWRSLNKTENQQQQQLFFCSNGCWRVESLLSFGQITSNLSHCFYSEELDGTFLFYFIGSPSVFQCSTIRLSGLQICEYSRISKFVKKFVRRLVTNSLPYSESVQTPVELIHTTTVLLSQPVWPRCMWAQRYYKAYELHK